MALQTMEAADDIAVGLESDIGDGVAQEEVADGELGHDVERRLLVGHGLDDPDGEDKDHGEDDGEEQGRPGHVGVDEAGHKGEGEGDGEEEDVPQVYKE